MVFNRDIARFSVGVIGNVIALILFLSPLPTFIRIWKNKSVEQFSPIPYLATFVNCGLWVLYGVPWVQPNSILVVTINGTGLGIEIVYLTLFFLYSDRKLRTKVFLVILGEIIFVATLAICVLSFVHGNKKRAAIVGSICMVGNILMYASPLAVMKLVIKTKSVEYMPFFLSLFSFLNGVSWTAYALIRFDAYILAPNSMGTVLGLAQLLLYATYYKSTKRQIAERETKGELVMAEKSVAGVAQKPRNDSRV
ncbi:bidirectional sugar transporter SWEET7-like [Nicotiana tabacum]|uniref:Bidirectional sugar transporter SWEET n=1 Tax=Nicotiana tabacum TaxID=4097 RepID=A0A1S4A5V7_TOBAC|nr:PREDICTED: bidirectional sugar transporter SWEET7-like [Nicotiana tabacum]